MKYRKRTHFFLEMEDNLNAFKNGRWSQIFEIETKPKTFFSNGRYPQYSFELNNLSCFKKDNATKKIQNKNNGCGTAPGNLVIQI